MKIVIDIPEAVYTSLKNGNLNEIQSMYICGSVANGTPLPQRYKDLFDLTRQGEDGDSDDE